MISGLQELRGVAYLNFCGEDNLPGADGHCVHMKMFFNRSNIITHCVMDRKGFIWVRDIDREHSFYDLVSDNDTKPAGFDVGDGRRISAIQLPDWIESEEDQQAWLHTLTQMFPDYADTFIDGISAHSEDVIDMASAAQKIFGIEKDKEDEPTTGQYL